MVVEEKPCEQMRKPLCASYYGKVLYEVSIDSLPRVVPVECRDHKVVIGFRLTYASTRLYVITIILVAVVKKSSELHKHSEHSTY